MNKLAQLLQSMSNSAASTVSAPVDVISWALRKAGVPGQDMPLGGSEWMERKGLTVPVEEGVPKIAGETLGGIASGLAFAPKIKYKK